jgi:Fe2+ transport system protein FeoA
MWSRQTALSAVPPGHEVVIESLQPGGRHGRGAHPWRGGGRAGTGGERLAALGFIAGTRLQVETNYGYGPVIVRIRGARVAVGRGQAARVLVRPMRRM